MPPVSPMLAKPIGQIPPGQLYEPKWDGFRSIIFRDGTWPYNDSSNTLGITRLTVNTVTGEIYGADIEVNATKILATFDLTGAPHGLYDVEGINPDGKTVQSFAFLPEKK